MDIILSKNKTKQNKNKQTTLHLMVFNRRIAAEHTAGASGISDS